MRNELLANIKKFLNSARVVYETKDYTSATVLYFKVIFVLADFILLSTIGRIPKDHNERFRLVEENFPELYNMLNKSFHIYRDTYRTTISRQNCDKVIKLAKEIIKKYNIPT